MAFRRKDVKKSSYYVWFLGAKECEGLRGEQLIYPVLHHFTDRENISESSKVTIQVSNKGIKIVQNVPRKGCKLAATLAGKTEQIKHFIPHSAITSVVQEEDTVCCILLIYNPVTKCPVHIHAYRCDSVETASSLRGQLQSLIERPENQRKFKEIEARLAAKGFQVSPASVMGNGNCNNKKNIAPISASSMPINSASANGINHLLSHYNHGKYISNKLHKKLSSDGRSIRTNSSDQTDDSFSSSLNSASGGSGAGLAKEAGVKGPAVEMTDSKVATLYESLAAELKAKLGNPKSGPILLPPRDYDTISRKQGKLSGIKARKSTNSQIVGPILEVSGGDEADTGEKLKPVKAERNGKSKSVSKNNVSSSPSKALVSASSSASSSCNKPSRPQSSCKSSSGIGSDKAIPPSPELAHHLHHSKFRVDKVPAKGKPITSSSLSSSSSRIHHHSSSSSSQKLINSSSSPINSSDDSDDFNWSPVTDNNGDDWSSSSDSGTQRPGHVPPPVIPKVKSASLITSPISKQRIDDKPGMPSKHPVKKAALSNSKPIHEQPPKYYFPDPQHGEFSPLNRSKLMSSNSASSASPSSCSSSSSQMKRLSANSNGQYHGRSSLISDITDRNSNLKPVPNFIQTSSPVSQYHHHHHHHHPYPSHPHQFNQYHPPHHHRSPITY